VAANELATLESVSNILRNLAQVAAFIVGGGWAYLKFVRGRTFAPRADLIVHAELFSFDDEPALTIAVEFRNGGLSIISLPAQGALLQLDYLASGQWEPGSPEWTGITLTGGETAALVDPTRLLAELGDTYLATAIFEDGHRVEPGDTLREEQFLIAPPSGLGEFPVAFRVQVVVTSKRRFGRRPVKW
jgi:hypothetical protein